MVARKRVWLNVTYFIAPLLAVGFWYFGGGMWVTPDVFFTGALVIAVFTHSARLFIIDWSPLTLLFFVYDSLRGIIPNAYPRAIRQILIDIDTRMFGDVPSVMLQNLLWKGTPQWYDVFFTVVYVMHFVIPLVLGFVLWKRSRIKYYRYIISLLVLSFWAYGTYYFIPAAPPWLAAHEGLLPGVINIQTQVFTSLGASVGIVVPKVLTIYDLVGGNAVAAIPSLHAAYPFLLFLFARRFFEKRVVWIIATYMVTVWFAVVYLGDHYVIDVVLGILYAGFTYLIVNHVIDKLMGSSVQKQWAVFDHWLRTVDFR